MSRETGQTCRRSSHQNTIHVPGINSIGPRIKGLSNVDGVNFERRTSNGVGCCKECFGIGMNGVVTRSRILTSETRSNQQFSVVSRINYSGVGEDVSRSCRGVGGVIDGPSVRTCTQLTRRGIGEGNQFWCTISPCNRSKYSSWAWVNIHVDGCGVFTSPRIVDDMGKGVKRVSGSFTIPKIHQS